MRPAEESGNIGPWVTYIQAPTCRFPCKAGLVALHKTNPNMTTGRLPTWRLSHRLGWERTFQPDIITDRSVTVPSVRLLVGCECAEILWLRVLRLMRRQAPKSKSHDYGWFPVSRVCWAQPIATTMVAMVNGKPPGFFFLYINFYFSYDNQLDHFNNHEDQNRNHNDHIPTPTPPSQLTSKPLDVSKRRWQQQWLEMWCFWRIPKTDRNRHIARISRDRAAKRKEKG